MAISYEGPPETRAFWGGSLPHWDVFERPIFLTIHVRGAIPAQAAQRIRQEASSLGDRHDSAYMDRLIRVFREMESWLDRADGEALLTRPEVAAMLRESIATRAQRGWWFPLEWVLMPNHLHILYVGGIVDMKQLMTDLKRWTGHQAATILRRDGRRFWQDEWFDHWSRSVNETDRIAAYIRENPVRAGLVSRSQDWPYGSWSEPAPGRSGLHRSGDDQ